MSHDLDMTRLLVERRGDTRRDRLEGVEDSGLSWLEQDEIADPDDDEAASLVRCHDTRGLLQGKCVANALQLGNALRRWRRWRRWWRRDDATLQFDGIVGMQRKRHGGRSLGVGGKQRP